MSDIKLFRLGLAGVLELQGKSMALEKSLQTLMEQHLKSFLGVRFLAVRRVNGLEGTHRTPAPASGGRMYDLLRVVLRRLSEEGTVVRVGRKSHESVFTLAWSLRRSNQTRGKALSVNG